MFLNKITYYSYSLFLLVGFRFIMLINHGFGSHCDRFDETAEKLNEIDGHVFCHDLGENLF